MDTQSKWQKVFNVSALLIVIFLSLLLHGRADLGLIESFFAALVICFAVILPISFFVNLFQCDDSWLERIGTFIQSFCLLVYIVAVVLLDDGKPVGFLEGLFFHFICVAIAAVPFGLGAVLRHFAPENSQRFD